jgi:dihydrolipoamide dehydrogenase
MKYFDVIVIGSGAGMNIVERALSQGLRVALVDKGPLGGTCLNLGCIPSKMLITPADTIAAIQDSRKLGLEVEIKKVDFQLIFDRMRNFIRNQQEEIRQSLRNIRNLEYFEAQTRFIRDLTLEVNGQAITAKKNIYHGRFTTPDTSN